MKKIYIVAGSGRSGTSFTCKILQELGFKLSKDAPDKINPDGGYMESRNIAHAEGFYNAAVNIKDGCFISLRIRRFLFKVGNIFLNRVLKKVDVIKMCEYIHIIKMLGYKPIIIGLWRDPEDYLISFGKQNSHYEGTYQYFLKNWKDCNENLLYYLSLYSGCLINFNDLIFNKNGWENKLADLIKIPTDYILEAYKKIKRPGKHNEDKSEIFLSEEIKNLRRRLIENEKI